MNVLEQILRKAAWAFEDDAEGDLEKIRFNLGNPSDGSNLDILMPTTEDGESCILDVMRFASVFNMLYSIGFNSQEGAVEISFEGVVYDDPKHWWIRFFCKMEEGTLDHVYDVKKGKITKR